MTSSYDLHLNPNTANYAALTLCISLRARPRSIPSA